MAWFSFRQTNDTLQAIVVGRDKHGPLQALVNGLIVYKGV